MKISSRISKLIGAAPFLAGVAVVMAAAGVLLAQGTLEIPRPNLGTPKQPAQQLGVPAATAPAGNSAQAKLDEAETTGVDETASAPLLIDDVDFVPDFREEIINVVVPVTVTDKNGDFIDGLMPYDFQLMDQGVPQRIQQDVATHPISLVVAVQTSSTARQILPAVQKVAPLFDSLVIGETGEVAVLGYDHRIQKHTNFTSDPNQIKAAFEKLKPGSRAAHLDDAAMEGILMLRNRGKDRKKILLLIGETRDEGSRMSPRDVLTEAEFHDVEIYAVNMSHLLNQLTAKAEPNRPNPIPVEGRMPLPMGQIATGTYDSQTNMGNWTPAIKEIFTMVKGIFVPNPMEVYTTYTGGREQNFATLDGLEEAITAIGEEIHSQYLLTYSPTTTDGGYHEIEVRVVASPDLTVRARRGYWIAPRQ